MEQQLLLSFHCTLVCCYITPVSNRMNIFGQHVNTRTAGMLCSTRVRKIEVEQYGFIIIPLHSWSRTCLSLQVLI